MNDFYMQKGAGTRKLYKAKNQIDYCRVTSLYGVAGVYQAVT